MKLSDALTLLAEKLALDAASIIAYAAEDHEGGRNAGYDGWSIDPDEGRLLYALVRALRPLQVLEIGVHEGASSAHLLTALDANQLGALTSYDIVKGAAEVKGIRWTVIQQDAALANFPPTEFVFEDSAHGLDYSLKLFERLKFARVLVTHDTLMTPAHGDFYVKQAFETVFPDGLIFALDGCERGLGVWVNPDWIAPLNSEMSLSKEELHEVINGGTLRVTAETVKVERKRAPDKVTRAKRTAKR